MELLYQLQLLREHGPSTLNSILVLFSEGTLVAAPLIAALLYWSVSKEKGEKIILAFGLSNFLSNLLKLIFCIYRPWVRDSRLHVAEEAAESATGYSFPSGHSTLAASIYCGSAMIFREKKKLRLPAILLTLLVMLARMYLGCHTLQDVCVGAAIGLLSVLIAEKLHDLISARKNGDLFFLAGALLFTAAVLLYISWKSYPLDYDAAGKLLVDPVLMQQDAFGAAGIFCGLAPGFCLEHRFIRFEMPAGKKQRILRCIAGALLFLFVYAFLMKKLTASMNPSAAKFLRYFVTILTATVLYPLILRAARGRL